MIERRRWMKTACAMLAWLALGWASSPLALGTAHRMHVENLFLEHWCSNNECPLDEYGCHYDERGEYHCH